MIVSIYGAGHNSTLQSDNRQTVVNDIYSSLLFCSQDVDTVIKKVAGRLEYVYIQVNNNQLIECTLFDT